MDEKEVEKRSLIYEIEDELWLLIKRRAWIILLVGAGGIWVIVHFVVNQVAERPLRELQKNLAQAELLADSAKSAASTAAASADQVTEQIASLTENIQHLMDQAKGVDNQFRIVAERITAEAKSAAIRSEKDFSAAQQRISALEALVKKIGEENEATRKATADYAKKIAALASQIKQEQKRFAENSQYTISIRFLSDRRDLAVQIQTRLSSVGFKGTLTEIPKTKISVAAYKNNTLGYTPQSEKKVQEVLALIKPLIKDVLTVKFEPGTEWVKYKLTVSPLFTDPNSMSLTLGS